MFNKIINHPRIIRILKILKVDNYIHTANTYWTNYKTDLNKTHQEIAGYSHAKDVQEAVDKTHQDLSDIVKEFLKDSNNSILDIGCGPGLYLKDFDKKNNSFGIDINKNMLELAKINCPDATFINSEFLEYNFDNKFDLIYSIGMLQYIPPNKIEAFINKIYDLLNSGGLVFISYPHATSEKDVIEPNINYVQYSPEFLNTVFRKKFKLIRNKHVVDDREIGVYDKNPYKAINTNYDKTYKNSCIVIAQKV